MFIRVIVVISVIYSVVSFMSLAKNEIEESKNAGNYLFAVKHLMRPDAAKNCASEANSRQLLAHVQQAEIDRLVQQAFFTCSTEHYTRTGPALTLAAMETVYLPLNATLLSEAGKRISLTNTKKSPRCSDYTSKLFELCPNLIRPLRYSNKYTNAD